MSESDPPDINMSSIKVAGLGGLGLVVVVVGMALEIPEVRWFVAVSLAGGLTGGALLILWRSWVVPSRPQGPTLMVDAPAMTEPVRPSSTDTSVKLAPSPLLS